MKNALRLLVPVVLVPLLVDCGTNRPAGTATAATAAAGTATAAWTTIYSVLMHPRCLNCHPAGNRPLVGDASEPHPQNVQRGVGGRGRYAMQCGACHQDHNLDAPALPPGVKLWHMPGPAMPLVFEGRSSRELCEQMKDPARNGGKTMAEILEHMSRDPLVLWGWSPGVGRTPVPVPHADVVAALKAWIDGGCACPEK